ncbi:MAG TPA: DUF763 domain-containing protein [Candidatus Latescibacteria bacterium]|nr:DUF763 domain-containing protein [Candidatus Latescibacterota bacterium]
MSSIPAVASPPYAVPSRWGPKWGCSWQGKGGQEEAFGYGLGREVDRLDVRNFVREPHSAVCCDRRGKALDMVADESEDARRASAELSSE